MKKIYWSTEKCENPSCNNFKKRYGKYVIKTCGNKECIIYTTQQTNMKKYGHISNLHSEMGKETIRQTLIKKYGDNITNISQIPEVKHKKSETCKKNFGVDWPMQSVEIRNKSKNTCLEKYGVDNVSKSIIIINKIREKLYEINESNGLTNLQNSKIKSRQTCLEKYGVEYYFQTQEFKDTLKKNLLKKYGADNIRKSKYFHDLMVKKGLWWDTNDSNYTKYKDYYHKVKLLTEKTFRKYSDLLCKFYLRNTNYHLDHIYSIHQGFIDNIEPEIISSIVNLQLIPSRVNFKKGIDCWITKNELINQYSKLKENTNVDDIKN